MTNYREYREAAQRIVDWDKRGAYVGEPTHMTVAIALVKDALTVARAILESAGASEGRQPEPSPASTKIRGAAQVPPPNPHNTQRPAALEDDDLAFGRALLLIDQLAKGERNADDAAAFLRVHKFKRHCR